MNEHFYVKTKIFCFIVGTLNVLLRVKGIATVDNLAWTLSGHQGPNWRKANVVVYPSGPFQVHMQI